MLIDLVKEKLTGIPSLYFGGKMKIDIFMQIEMAKILLFQNISTEKMDRVDHYTAWQQKNRQKEKKKTTGKKKKQGHCVVYPLAILFFFRIFANLFSPRRLLVISSFIVAESILICASAYVREALKRLGKTKDIMIHNWILKIKTLFCLAESEVCYQSWFTIIEHSTPKCSKNNGQNRTDLARY